MLTGKARKSPWYAFWQSPDECARAMYIAVQRLGRHCRKDFRKLSVLPSLRHEHKVFSLHGVECKCRIPAAAAAVAGARLQLGGCCCPWQSQTEQTACWQGRH